MGPLDWELGTKDPHSDPVDKTFLGLRIVSNVSKWSNFLLEMGQKLLSLAPVLQRDILNGQSQKWSKITTGILEGSTLGPLFLLVFINDVPQNAELTTIFFQ